MTTVERQETPTTSGAALAIDRYVAGVTLLAAAFMLVAGVWALFWPDSFAEAVRFPEHTHFLHDVGAFQIGIGVTLALAVLWRDPPAVVLTGFVVGNTIHAANHTVDLDLGGRDSDPWLLGLLSVLVAVGSSGGCGSCTTWLAASNPPAIPGWRPLSSRRLRSSRPSGVTARRSPRR
jgi:hypothetical protein